MDGVRILQILIILAIIGVINNLLRLYRTLKFWNKKNIILI